MWGRALLLSGKRMAPRRPRRRKVGSEAKCNCRAPSDRNLEWNCLDRAEPLVGSVTLFCYGVMCYWGSKLHTILESLSLLSNAPYLALFKTLPSSFVANGNFQNLFIETPEPWNDRRPPLEDIFICISLNSIVNFFGFLLIAHRTLNT